MARAVVIINTNVARPPVSPVGLEYVGEALVEFGIPVRVLDLAFEADWRQALARELNQIEPLAVGMSVRNTDDSSFVTRKSFLPWIVDVVAEVRRLSDAFLLLGGVGFSIMPEVILEVTKADAGIAGDGEETITALAKCLMDGEAFTHLPNMVCWHDGNVVSNPRVETDVQHLPTPRRRLFDNKRYEELGAMVGIETKRGCPQQCIFCADPVAKGSRMRLRPPQTVAQEFQDLVDQGVSWFHLGDSEFNLPIGHAKDVCRTLIEAGLADKVRWYTYCAPTPFDQELARLMKRAGCAGIDFGVDSLHDGQLRRLGRTHSTADITDLVQLLKSERLNYMFDLLIGCPGETEETVRTTIVKAKELDVPLTGIASGIRVYPGTPLGESVAAGSIREGLHPKARCSLHEPLFYLSPTLGGDASALIRKLIAGDQRFLLLSSPAEDGSYNYADDEALCQLITEGARGAYWDIIRRSQVSK